VRCSAMLLAIALAVLVLIQVIPIRPSCQVVCSIVGQGRWSMSKSGLVEAAANTELVGMALKMFKKSLGWKLCRVMIGFEGARGDCSLGLCLAGVETTSKVCGVRRSVL
jgi:hypothetical protein